MSKLHYKSRDDVTSDAITVMFAQVCSHRHVHTAMFAQSRDDAMMSYALPLICIKYIKEKTLCQSTHYTSGRRERYQRRERLSKLHYEYRDDVTSDAIRHVSTGMFAQLPSHRLTSLPLLYVQLCSHTSVRTGMVSQLCSHRLTSLPPLYVQP